MTGWTYPNFEWAKAHVPGVPDRCLLSGSRPDVRRMMSRELCPDPVTHHNLYLESRGVPEDLRLEVPEELRTSVDADDAQEATIDAFDASLDYMTLSIATVFNVPLDVLGNREIADRLLPKMTIKNVTKPYEGEDE